jgi:hypothetical protein
MIFSCYKQRISLVEANRRFCILLSVKITKNKKNSKKHSRRKIVVWSGAVICSGALSVVTPTGSVAAVDAAKTYLPSFEDNFSYMGPLFGQRPVAYIRIFTLL